MCKIISIVKINLSAKIIEISDIKPKKATL